jgi:hypothetical protein
MADEHSSGHGYLRNALGAGKDCLAVEKLEMCLEGDVPPHLSRHLESCVHCRTELDLLRSFYTPPRDPAEAEAVRQITERLQTPRPIRRAVPRSWWKDLLEVRWLSPAAVVLAAMLIVTAVGLQWRHGAAPGLYAPNRPEDNVLRSGRLTLIGPSGDLEAVPTQIQWQTLPGAATYQVRMLEVDHSEIWTASTPASQLEIPALVRTRIVPAKPFLLKVTALDTSGRTLGESNVVRFRLLQKVHTR